MEQGWKALACNLSVIKFHTMIGKVVHIAQTIFYFPNCLVEIHYCIAIISYQELVAYKTQNSKCYIWNSCA